MYAGWVPSLRGLASWLGMAEGRWKEVLPGWALRSDDLSDMPPADFWPGCRSAGVAAGWGGSPRRGASAAGSRRELRGEGMVMKSKGSSSGSGPVPPRKEPCHDKPWAPDIRSSRRAQEWCSMHVQAAQLEGSWACWALAMMVPGGIRLLSVWWRAR